MDVMEPAEHAEHPKAAFYWKIWGLLLVLTILEVLASLKLTLPKGEMIVLLVGMAIVKAILVALYFMHLRYERVSLGITISLTLVLALILVFANMMQWLFHSPSTVMPPR
ncbi:MAG: cytochrome C oxidase subunit IV family protein [Thermoanaerobaculia bacterium]